MAEYRFPAEIYDRPRNLLAVLGSFWSRTYTAQDQLESYLRAAALQLAQTQLNLMEAIACVSRLTVPLFHRTNWYFLTLKQSDRNTSDAVVPRYGDDGLVYGESDRYGMPRTVGDYTFPIPAELIRVGTIMNRLTEPSVVFTDTIDYHLDASRGLLSFRDDPFANPLLPQRPVYKDGEIIDQELDLWVFRGEFDWQFMYVQFGYLLGLKMQSSQGYKDLLNALFDALALGASDRALEQAMSAMTGVPLVQELAETVEVVEAGCGQVLIVTDRNVYKFRGGATPLVAVGDTVTAGQALIDGLRFYELNRGELPADLPALSLGPGFLANCYYADLIFENKTVRLTVDTTHESGYTYVSFPVGGFPADVEKFFDELHARGIADAERAVANNCDETGRRRGTLAHLLDKRAQPSNEPSGQHLPETLNPLQFLIMNVLRNNAFVVHVKSAAMGKFRLGLYNARHLRKLLPPHTAMILVIEITAEPEVFSPSLLSEATSQFTAMNPLQDAVSESLVRERPIGVRQISGTCQ